MSLQQHSNIPNLSIKQRNQLQTYQQKHDTELKTTCFETNQSYNNITSFKSRKQLEKYFESLCITSN